MRTAVWTMVLLLGVAGVANADLIGSYKTFDLAEPGWWNGWDTTDIIYEGADFDAPTPADAGWLEMFMANDSDYLYIGWDVPEDGASIENDWVRRVYFDTDQDGGTGWNSGWMTHGYDFMIQYGQDFGTTHSVFEFTGATQDDWSWGFIDTMTYTFDDTEGRVGLRIALADLGLDPEDKDQIQVQVHVTGGDVTAEGWATNPESGNSWYQVIPEPGTMGLLAIGFLGVMGLRRRMK